MFRKIINWTLNFVEKFKKDDSINIKVINRKLPFLDSSSILMVLKDRAEKEGRNFF